jgi:2-keto-4-pentenoate hydratase
MEPNCGTGGYARQPPRTSSGLVFPVTAGEHAYKTQRHFGEDRMNTDRVKAAAATLADLRARLATVEQLPDEALPASVEEAYATQDILIDRLPGPLVGWKIGATGKEAQAKLGTSEPFAGPLFAPGLKTSPATLARADYTHTLIESEFAYRMAKPLPARDTSYSEDEVADAVGALVPAIEIIGPCFATPIGGHLFSRIADCGVSAGVVLGDDITDWRGVDLAAHEVTLRVDGESVASGTGALVLGHPMKALCWLVEHLRVRGRGLGAGEVVSTGTTTGIYPLEANAQAVADFGALGEVHVTFKS